MHRWHTAEPARPAGQSDGPVQTPEQSSPLSDRRKVPDGIGDLQFEPVQPTSSRRIRAERSSFAEAVKTRAMVEPTRGRLEMPPQMADLEPPRRPQMAIAERAHPAPADARFRARRAHGRLNRHYLARALQPWNPHTQRESMTPIGETGRVSADRLQPGCRLADKRSRPTALEDTTDSTGQRASGGRRACSSWAGGVPRHRNSGCRQAVARQSRDPSADGPARARSPLRSR
jgi:hypothetical protein